MDLFRLLSRGTKLQKPTKSSNQLPSDASLPSAGQNTTPQLFGNHEIKEQDSESHSVLGKRRRSSPSQEELPAELDFFRSSSSKSKIQNGTDTQDDHGSHKSEIRAPEEVLEELDVDHCKKMLRSHRIKITLLDGSPFREKQQKRKQSPKQRADLDEKKNPKPSQVILQPLSSFSRLERQCRLRRQLSENIAAQGYSVPTEVQMAALPLLLNGNLFRLHESGDYDTASVGRVDLLTSAPTGSGKTLAFLIPILNQLLVDRVEGDVVRLGPRAIVLAPTRELASQIVNEGRKLALRTGMKVTLVKKGMRIGTEPSDLDTLEDELDSEEDFSVHEDATPTSVVKSDVLVSTPLALGNALSRPGGKTARLPFAKHLVLDEADVLLDPLFKEQTLAVWNACTNSDLRTSLWSATLASSVESFAVDTIKRKQETPSTVIRLVVGFKDTAVHTLSHKLVYAATEQGKLLAIRQLLHPTAPSSSEEPKSAKGQSLTELRPPFLVFTQTIPRATALHSELLYDIPPEAGGSSRIAVLHSSLSDSARSNIMAGFRKGEIWVIITTDLLARGVDFKGLNGVVNYDVPTSAAAYVHRAGRTGRAGRRGGVVVTLYTEEDVGSIKPIVNVIRQAEKARAAEDGKEIVNGLPDWLLSSLPTPSKNDKKRLKQRGVEIRRPNVKAASISTKVKARGGFINPGRPNSKRASKKQPEPDESIEFDGFED